MCADGKANNTNREKEREREREKKKERKKEKEKEIIYFIDISLGNNALCITRVTQLRYRAPRYRDLPGIPLPSHPPGPVSASPSSLRDMQILVI
jgi:hypothetical protein